MYHWQNTNNGWEEKIETWDTFSNEYTTGMLLEDWGTQLGDAINDAETNDDPFVGNANPAIYNLATDEQSVDGQAMQYRFRVIGPQDEAFRVKWQMITVHDDGSTWHGPIQDEIVYGNGTTNYSSIHTEWPVADKNGSTYVVFYGAQKVVDCDHCAYDYVAPAPERMNREVPGSGKPDLPFGGPSFSASMGTGPLGKSAGEIIYTARTCLTNLANAAMLEFSNPSSLSEVIYQNGHIMQVKAPQSAAD
jgi:hypothetical protein